MVDTIEYSVQVESASAHRASFFARVPTHGAASMEFVLPSWVPGSYHIQDRVRYLYGFRGSDPSSGAPRAVERLAKDRWRIATEGTQEIEAQWEVYGNDLITEAVDVDESHLFLNAALCLPYIEGRKSEPADLVVHVPEGWKVYSELAQVGRHPTRLRAPDYDTLVDNPVDCGTPVELLIHPSGIPHRILFCGAGGNYEVHRVEQDLGRLVETAIGLFGGSPIPRYTFFYHLSDHPDGGLEHASSTSIVLSRHTFRPAKSYRRFLLTSAHEYLHLYNVKRIRPKRLDSIDYTTENYTRLLWWMEGTTDYYAHLVLRRSGAVPLAGLYELFGELLHRYLTTPGRNAQSLEELSFGTWTDLYRAHEETPNRSVSYYVKGLLASVALDLEIRHRSENRRSLDDVLRKLWNDFGHSATGVDEGGILPAAEAATGLSLGDFFRKFISGREELDLVGAFRHAGLRLEPKPRDPKEEDEPGWIGVLFRDAGGLPQLTTVFDGGPARRAGLSSGDQIVALNDARIGFDRFDKVWERFPPGSELDVSYFRRGMLRRAPLTTGRKPAEGYRFNPVEAPTAVEKAIFESWLATGWEPPKPEESSSSPKGDRSKPGAALPAPAAGSP